MAGETMRRAIRWVVVAVLPFALSACGRVETAAVSTQPRSRNVGSEVVAGESADFSDASVSLEAMGAQAPGEGAASQAAANRKIVYTADVRLVVDDVSSFVAEVRRQTVDLGGFVGDATESGRTGSYRTATLTVRVPSAAYGRLLDQVSLLGEVERRQETAADVTAQFVDLDARLRNKRREEERLVELLTDATGKLVDVLAVEKELSRVREEVERYQGQMNVLSDQIALSTVTISAEEQRTYEPSRPRTLGDRLAAAWGNSLGRIGEFFTRLVVELVAFVPWLVIWVPLGLVVWSVWNKLRRGDRTDV